MRIDDYEVEREIFANQHGLTVYEVTSLHDGKSYILRLLDSSSHQTGFQTDHWYNIYEQYQLTITNFKHLPRVFSINMIDEFRLYTVLEGEQGNSLEKKGSMGRDEILQLIDAVHHLHQKKIVHGSICAKNIWLTHTGRVILYGAGEAKVISGNQQDDRVSDIKQLVHVIDQYATLAPGIIRNLETQTPRTLEELEAIIWKEEPLRTTQNEEKQGGLVEKGELRISKEIPIPASVGESQYIRQLKEARISRGNQISPPRETRKRMEQREGQKKPWLWVFVVAIAGAIALLVAYEWFPYATFQRIQTPRELPIVSEPSSSEEQEQPTDTPDEQTTENHDDEKQIDMQKEEVQQESAPVAYTKEDVQALMQEYAAARMKAWNNHNFSVVEHFLDSTGSAYQELLDDYNYIENNKITEKMLTFDVSNIIQIDQSTYKVSTYEEYERSYNNAKKETKRWNGTYIIKVLQDDDQLAINERIYKQKPDSIQDGIEKSTSSTTSSNEESTTKANIPAFMEKYMKAWGQALQQHDFSDVKELLDPDGTAYQNVSNYIQSLRNHSALEELVTYKVGNVTKLDETSYQVMVHEEYRPTGSNGIKEVKSFNTEYIIIESDGQLLVHEQLKNGLIDGEVLNQ